MNQCAICGEFFTEFFGYDFHAKRIHGGMTAKFVEEVPVKVEKKYEQMPHEKKKEIVKRWEKKHARFLIG